MLLDSLDRAELGGAVEALERLNDLLDVINHPLVVCTVVPEWGEVVSLEVVFGQAARTEEALVSCPVLVAYDREVGRILTVALLHCLI